MISDCVAALLACSAPSTYTDVFPIECSYYHATGGASMSKQFSQQDIPLPSTFAFRSKAPCRVEHPSQIGLGPNYTDVGCPYFHDCHATSALTMVRRAYGRHIAVSLAEPSSNIVVRSENLFNRDERHRLTLRKHFYEVRAGSEKQQFLLSGGIIDGVCECLRYMKKRDDRFPLDLETIDRVSLALHELVYSDKKRPQEVWHDIEEFRTAVVSALTGLKLPFASNNMVQTHLEWHASSPLGCLSIGNNVRFAKYLGFVDLRTHSPVSPVALALLVPPRDIRHDRDATLVTGQYGRLFGAHSFRSTVYSMHDPKSGGAHCAQACLMMVSSMLADRGVKIHGSYDLTFFSEKDVPYSHLADEQKQAALTDTGISRIFRVRGLTHGEMVSILNRDESNASADGVFLEFDNEENWTNRRLAKRLVDAYISARCPAILLVHGGRWWGTSQEGGHAVVVVGVRRGVTDQPRHGRQYTHEVTELILHDPGHAPFLIRPMDECLDASFALGSITNKTKCGGFSFVFAIDVNVRRHALNCVDALFKHDLLGWSRYVAVPPEAESELSTSIRGKMGASHETDYDIRLVHRDDVPRTYCCASYNLHTARRKSRPDEYGTVDEKLRPFRIVYDRVRKLKRGWYWCIAGYNRKDLEVMWLFSAEGVDDAEWDCCIDLR